MSITWLNDDDVTDVKTTPAPPQRSATGYGRKLPQRYMLRIEGRWHRLYAMCFSNVATFYVLRGGQELVLDSGTEHRLELIRDDAPMPVRLDTLTVGDRFRFQHDGVACTFKGAGGGKYLWHDYKGDHHLYAGSWVKTGAPAWPYVYPTDDPETEVTLP